MKRKIANLFLLIWVVAIAAFSASYLTADKITVEPTPTPAPTAEPTPTPTPEPTPEPTPTPVPFYDFEVYGQQFNTADKFIDLNHIEIDDDGAALMEHLPYCYNLEAVDMDSCGVSNEAMAAIRDAFPDIEVIWRVNFGGNYSVRTNVTKILASMPSKGGDVNNADAEQLKYCTKVRYLDLGHNEGFSDFSFVEYMPDLEIAVISMTAVTDLSPFSKCENLMYLEAGNTRITNLSPLAECKNLHHLNVGTCEGVSDISCLYDLDLIRLWLGSVDPVPKAQVEEMQSKHPNCEINTTAPSGNERNEYGEATNEGYTSEEWKKYQQYLDYDYDYLSNNGCWPAQRPLGYFKVVYKAFEYDKLTGAYAFYWNDPKYEAHGPDVEPVNTKIIDTSLLGQLWTYEENAVIQNVEDPPGDTISVDPY